MFRQQNKAFGQLIIKRSPTGTAGVGAAAPKASPVQLPWQLSVYRIPDKRALTVGYVRLGHQSKLISETPAETHWEMVTGFHFKGLG